MSPSITAKITEKRTDLTNRYEAIATKVAAFKKETSERVLVVRLGVDSAWDELKTAFETATARHPNESTGHGHSESAKS